jgi:hypothetical protein
VINEKQISWNFLIKYFHLICHLILTKINCITLKIHSKADFKSKSQNIWQQIILFSCTVMQMICAWPKIWTLSGRLSLMRTVQFMKKMSDASKNTFRVYHIGIIAPKKKLIMVHSTWNRQIHFQLWELFCRSWHAEHVCSLNFPSISNSFWDIRWKY